MHTYCQTPAHDLYEAVNDLAGVQRAMHGKSRSNAQVRPLKYTLPAGPISPS